MRRRPARHQEGGLCRVRERGQVIAAPTAAREDRGAEACSLLPGLGQWGTAQGTAQGNSACSCGEVRWPVRCNVVPDFRLGTGALCSLA